MTIKMSVLAACVASAFVASPVVAAETGTTAAIPSSVKGQFVDLPGVHLWYLDSGGDGTPVVMLHANTGTSESWRYQFEPLIKAGYRVIAFDRRGRGQSTPADTGPQPGSVSEDLEALAAGGRDGIALMQGWRYDVFGHAALDLVEGRMGFAVKNGKLVMSEIDTATASEV